MNADVYWINCYVVSVEGARATFRNLTVFPRGG